MLDVVLILIFIVLPAIVLHELAHGLSAALLGDKTAQLRGRLTLNPLKHLDVVGSLLLPGGLFLLHKLNVLPSLWLFGWAKPVPVNFSQLRWSRFGILLVAISGPVVNILLAGLYAFFYHVEVLQPWAFFWIWGVIFNLMLACFNMLPIPPLDGSRVLMSLLPQRFDQFFYQIEPFGIWILIFLIQLKVFYFILPVVSYLASFIGIQI